MVHELCMSWGPTKIRPRTPFYILNMVIGAFLTLLFRVQSIILRTFGALLCRWAAFGAVDPSLALRFGAGMVRDHLEPVVTFALLASPSCMCH